MRKGFYLNFKPDNEIDQRVNNWIEKQVNASAAIKSLIVQADSQQGHITNQQLWEKLQRIEDQIASGQFVHRDSGETVTMDDFSPLDVFGT